MRRFVVHKGSWVMTRASLGVVAAAMVLAGSVAAETVPRLDPGVELQRQQQEQLLQRQLETPRTDLGPVEAPPRQEVPSPACVAVRQVRIGGATLLPAEALARVAASFEGRCLTQESIGQLLQAINAAYVDKGYVTSRAYLPEQDVQGGVLALVVIEGTIEDIRLNDNARAADRRRVALAFPTRKNKALRLADIEQGVDQLNRASSAQAAVALEPGTQTGKTRVIVHTVDDPTWRAGLTVDNNGEAVTGRYKTTGTLDKDNLLEANDVWQLALSHTEDTRALSLSTSLPVGYWTFSTSYSESEYSNDLGAGLALKGDSHSAMLNADYLFYRNQHHQLALVTGVSSKDSGRDVSGVSLLPEGTATTRLGLRWLRRDDLRTIFLQSAWVHGTDWLDAIKDPAGLPANFPHHQFDKFEVQGQYATRFSERFAYSAQLQAQYAERGLVGGEQMVLGGLDSIRGFNTSSAYGDKGVSLRNQLSTACSLKWLPQLECQAFLDAGVTRALMAPPVMRLVGGGVGAKLSWRHAFAETSVAAPVYASDSIDTDTLEIHFQIGVRY